MTPAMKRLRELRERQSKERGRMSELAIAETLTDETRAEFDGLESGTGGPGAPDPGRSNGRGRHRRRCRDPLRRAGYRDARADRTAQQGDVLPNYMVASRMQSRAVDRRRGRALQAAAGVQGIPLELWDVPAPTEQRAATEAPGTVGVNLDAIRPAVFANSIAPRLGDRNAASHESGTYASATIAD